MENLKLYNQVRVVPKEAQKEIKAGRLSGKTDINPMWRIKALTEQFGPCGFGWYAEILKQWTEVGAGGEISAFCNIALYIKIGDEWSKPVLGTGGSSFVAKETKGLYVSDECFKMAYTDAISVSCKMLGFGADIYWEKDNTKYDTPPKPTNTTSPTENPALALIGTNHIATIAAELQRTGWDVGGMLTYINSKGGNLKKIEDMNITQFKFIMGALKKKPDKAACA